MIRILNKWSKNGQKATAERIYKCFLKNEKKWTIIHNDEGLYEGVLYQKDVEGNVSFHRVEELRDIYSSRNTVAYIDDYDIMYEYASAILEKNKDIDAVPVIKDGIVEFVYERITHDVNAEERMMLLKYSIIQQYGYSIGKYLLDKGIKNINIVGASMPLIPIFNDLKNNGITIQNVIDHKALIIGDKKTKKWQKTEVEDWTSVDANIIMYMSTQEILFNSIKKKGVDDEKILVISDIINCLYKIVTECYEAALCLKEYIDKGVAIKYFRLPCVDDIKEKSKTEKLIYHESTKPIVYKNNFDKYKELLKTTIGFTANENIIKSEILDVDIPIIFNGETYELADFSSEYYNILNGMRLTSDQPEKYDRKIFLFGNSNIFGKYEREEYTIASNVQRFCNEENKNCIVYNQGEIGKKKTGGVLNLYKRIKNNKDINDDDIIVIADRDDEMEFVLKQAGIEVIDSSDIVQRPRIYDNIFVDRTHFNESGAFVFAQEVFKKCFDTKQKQDNIKVNFNINKKLINDWTEISAEELKREEELSKYLNYLPEKKDGVSGAIVMNCNPFTKGHRFLIERAAENVDNLYIFVVEEDASLFPFSDRYNMVVENTKDIKNVTVLKSGSFIISSQTFPEYFNKDDVQDVNINPNKDLKIFCEKIAPKLNITKRFAGVEPIDKITKQYNAAMANTLPKYGIEFIEIPRIKNGNQVISASLVREILEKGKFKDIKKYVTETTYKYLYDMFFKD